MVGRKRWVVTDEMLEELREAHSKGETIKSVAQRHNINYPNLAAWARRIGLKFKTGPKKNSRRSLEIGKKISDSKRGANYLERRARVISDYLQDKNLTWDYLAQRHGFTEVEVKVMIGEHLMAVCRADEECPWKPLLPEYREEKK